MILMNIDQLSDAELRYIAKQEKLENWDSLGREELIGTLEELYDDDSVPSADTNRKFVKALTDINSDVLQLPGVEPLPKSFNDNEIHFILTDTNWAYVFWGFDIITKKKIEETKAQTVIKVTADGDKSYEIIVGKNDDNWNIELPWAGKTYKMSLIIRTEDGDEVAAVSESEQTPMHWIDNAPDVLSDSDEYEILVSSLIAKDGTSVDCSDVKKIIGKYRGNAE